MTSTRDFRISLNSSQAVLVEVIRRCEVRGHKIGRTALQKIAYFLVVRGVPLDYRFDLYHYGPFCQDILHDAGFLEALEAIADSKDGYMGGSKYKVTEHAESLMQEHEEFINVHTETIDSVVGLLAGLNATHLEYVATIDYFDRYVAAMERSGPRREEVLRRFFEAKPQREGDRAQVEALYDRMAKIGMIGK